MLFRLAAAALAMVAGTTLWAATSLAEGSTARADEPGLLGGGDSGGILGGLAGGEGGLLETISSLPAEVEELTAPAAQAAPAQPATKPAPLLDMQPFLEPATDEAVEPPGALGAILQPTLEAAASVVDSTIETPLVSSILETVEPVIDDALLAVDPVLDELPATLEPVVPAAPILDTLPPALNGGEKPQTAAVPGGDPKAPESPVPAPEQPSVPAKPSANPALPSSSAPARNAVFEPPAGPEHPTEGAANPVPTRAPAVPNDPSFSMTGAHSAVAGGPAFAFALAADTGVSVQTEVLAIGDGNAASEASPVDLRGGHAMTAASGTSSTFSSSAGTFAVLAMALAVGTCALLSRRLNLEWLVPPSMAWAPEVPPAR